jgi:NitT/TauT family transport system permease protein
MPTRFSATRAALQGADGALPVNPPADDDAAANRLTGLDALERVQTNETPLGVRIWRGAWPKLLAVAIVLLVWQSVVWAQWKPEYVLPGPATVFGSLKDLIVTGDFWDGVRLTMIRAVSGFLFAVVLGTLIGAAVSRFTPLRAAIGSLITGRRRCRRSCGSRWPSCCSRSARARSCSWSSSAPRLRSRTG